ncbi:MAG: NAD-binding protein [Chloroflexota bacterium]|nr:NAD-binding protein [Chloroflexota bacterium]
MQVLIFGCTRQADALVPVLVHDGHHVTVMDTDSDRLAIMKRQTDIEPVWIADPLMQDFLIEGKIETAEAFYSLSDDDHKNLLLCQIASEIYNVPRTMCLLSDPQLQAFYEPLGMRVINAGRDFLNSAQELIAR